jgi:hypothetical protein
MSVADAQELNLHPGTRLAVESDHPVIAMRYWRLV